MKLKASRSSVTSAKSMGTSAPHAQTGRSESNCPHRSLIFLSFQSSVTPAADWDTKHPCALRRRITRCAIKPQDPQARQCKARQQLSTTTLPAYLVGATTTSPTTVPVSAPKPFSSRDALATYIHLSILRLECQV